jgi:toxin ParE1/3/4
MKKARLSDPAELDLAELWFHIARDSPTAADRLVRRILDTCDVLAQRPFAGELYEKFGPDTRIFTVRPYVIVFRPSDDGIEVMRVVHGARDLEALF